MSSTPVESRVSSTHTSATPSSSTSRTVTFVFAAFVAVIAAILLAPSSLRSWRASVPLLKATTQSRTTFSPPTWTNMPTSKVDNPKDPKWSEMAVRMDAFHNHFRYEFNRVYTLADGGFHKEGMSLPRFLREAQGLYQHLDMHHRIEAYIFPILAKKMPQFKAGARESGEHLKSHRAIHEGLEKYETFLHDSLADQSKYNAPTLRAIMDGFREVLFRHLDEEVRDLGAESMQAAGWTLAELRQIPM